MSNILSCITGPRLYSGPSSSGNQIINYSSNFLESFPQFTISSTKVFMGIFKWTVFLWMPIVYKKYKTTDNILSTGKLMMYAITTYWTLCVIRGFGRIVNPMYTDFMEVLQRAKAATTPENMEALSRYNFDFSHWPVQFDAAQFRNRETMKNAPKRSMSIPSVFKPICYFLAHTIGIRMAFPGCTTLFNTLVAGQRRDRLLVMQQQKNVKRVKIRTVDNNEIEALYRDNRAGADPNGKVLVICCEGNAGYAELGNPKVALEKNYSVIGWNHPGFGGSTGMPFPKSEQAAIDAVMQFALHRLNFSEKDILIFGWSIGGYTASWAAMNYRNIRGLVLDATFDNIDKIAEKSLPLVLYPLVLATVYEYIDLSVDSQLTDFNGKIRFIIRGHDEIISVEQGNKASNRGFFLLEKILRQRYPDLICDESIQQLWHYFSSPKSDARAFVERNVDKKLCEEFLLSGLKIIQSRPTRNQETDSSGEHNSTKTLYPFPIKKVEKVEPLTSTFKAQLLVYLASQYMIEFEQTHCTELPSRYLTEGWNEYELIQGSTTNNNTIINSLLQNPSSDQRPYMVDSNNSTTNLHDDDINDNSDSH